MKKPVPSHKGMSRKFIQSDRALRHRIFGFENRSEQSVRLRGVAPKIVTDTIQKYKEEYNDSGARVSATVVGSAATGSAVKRRSGSSSSSDLDTFYFISNSRFKEPGEVHESSVFSTLNDMHMRSSQKAGISGHVNDVIYLDQLISELRTMKILTGWGGAKRRGLGAVLGAVTALFFPAIKGSLLPERKKLLSALKEHPHRESLWKEIQVEWRERVMHAMRRRPEKVSEEEIKLMDFDKICKLYGV